MEYKIIIEAVSLGGTTHRLTGGVKGRESVPFTDVEEAKAKLERIGWRVIRVIKG